MTAALSIGLRRLSPTTLEWLGALGITALAFLLRVVHLGSPHSFEYDETYYAKEAWSMLHFGYSRDYVDSANDQILAGHTLGQWTSSPEMVVHPEVGKWLIAIGIKLFGMNPFGWRIVPAVIGSLMVLVMIRFAKRVTGSGLLGLTAGVVMCFDGLELVLSRLALLDIFLAFFLLLAVHCLVADRQWSRARSVGHPVERLGWWRPWRFASGLAFGLALGSKWTALYPLAALILLALAWDIGARRRRALAQHSLRSDIGMVVSLCAYLLVLPLVVYLATWTGWLLNYQVYERALSNTQYGAWGAYASKPAHGIDMFFRAFRDLWHYHVSVYNFHTKFLNTTHHTYQSNPIGWLILNRPVGADAQLGIKPGEQGCVAAATSTCLRQVLIMGNPAVWWAGSAAGIWAALNAVLRRDWRFTLAVVAIATTWLPWLHYAQRPIFSYYAIATEPFLILALVLTLGQLIGPATSGRRRTYGAIAAGAVVVTVVGMFWFFWPIWTDGLLSNEQWLDRIWFKSWI